MEGFLRYDFEGAYIWKGLYMEGLILGILRYAPYQSLLQKADKITCKCAIE